MLKYKVQPREPRSISAAAGASKLYRNSSMSAAETPPPRPAHRTLIHIRNGPASCSSSTSSGSMSDLSTTATHAPNFRVRSTSLSSLSSVDSGETNSDWGHLRVFTRNIKADTDYKTLKISSQTSALTVIQMLLSKFRLAHRDPNLFRLCMEITTRYMGNLIKSILELDDAARPLELQRCHPLNMSRFLMVVANDPVLTRIDDSIICPQSNYKSLLLSRRTTALETIRLLLQICRVTNVDETNFKLYLTNSDTEVELSYDVRVADIYLQMSPEQKLVLRRLF
ncbi:Ras-associating domain-containing protein [Aphelenchoides besseyi]|nr:Ras-associating domain-containing protein [Aphelenchoides besseyi]KAI6207575.1 Ras-associating domain-containing protein [Aphelenchoides besseyi]